MKLHGRELFTWESDTILAVAIDKVAKFMWQDDFYAEQIADLLLLFTSRDKLNVEQFLDIFEEEVSPQEYADLEKVKSAIECGYNQGPEDKFRSAVVEQFAFSRLGGAKQVRMFSDGGKPLDGHDVDVFSSQQDVYMAVECRLNVYAAFHKDSSRTIGKMQFLTDLQSNVQATMGTCRVAVLTFLSCTENVRWNQIVPYLTSGWPEVSMLDVSAFIRVCRSLNVAFDSSQLV